MPLNQEWGQEIEKENVDIVDEKLAVLPPLNPKEEKEGEDKKDKEKVVMLVDVAADGSTSYI